MKITYESHKLMSFFIFNPTYEFIKFFFELDSVANWKVFICNNIKDIIYILIY